MPLPHWLPVSQFARIWEMGYNPHQENAPHSNHRRREDAGDATAKSSQAGTKEVSGKPNHDPGLKPAYGPFQAGYGATVAA